MLIRRSLSDPSELAYFYYHAPAGRTVSLPVLIKIADKRWPEEECHQQGNGQAGLDGHQVWLWPSFHRHTVLSMCALALLAAPARPPAPLASAQAAGTIPDGPAQPAAWAGTGILPASANEPPPQDPGMVKVSVPEARRLLHLATTPMTAAARQLGYAWSRWRRKHQARARYHHHQARLRAARHDHDQVTNRDCSTGPGDGLTSHSAGSDPGCCACWKACEGIGQL